MEQVSEYSKIANDDLNLCERGDATSYVVLKVEELQYSADISFLDTVERFGQKYPYIKAAVVGLPLAVAGAGAAATAAGFGTLGIVGGSVAASIQSISIGGRWLVVCYHPEPWDDGPGRLPQWQPAPKQRKANLSSQAAMWMIV